MTEINEHTVPGTDAAEKENAPVTVKPETAVSDPKPVTWEIFILLTLSFIAAAWYGFGHTSILEVVDPYHGPGIGLTVTHWTLTAAVLLFARIRKTLKITRDGAFLLILSLLLSAVYGIYANTVMKALNLPVLLLSSGQALFTLTGHNGFSPLSGQGLWEGFRRYFASLANSWDVPVRCMIRRKKNGEERQAKTGQVIFGIFAAGIVAVLAVNMLSSADEIFSGMLESMAEQVQHIDGIFVARLLLTFLLGMLIFSHRAGMLREPVKISTVNPGKKNPTVIRMVLAALAVVYGLFAYVQIRYLFAGAESVKMSGGYAAYARSGFFQLVMVALLTLCLIMPALVLCKEDKSVRILSVLVAVLTTVIDVSAFFRMHLYIDVYGLTTLRIVTLWGIGMILLALIAAAVKALLPHVRVCPALAAVILTTWIGMNIMNIDRVVAENQVARLNAEIRQDAGQIRESSGWSVQIAALASDQYWSPDYYAAFEKIEDGQARSDALGLLEKRAEEKRIPHIARDIRYQERKRREITLYDWNTGWLRIPGNK